MMLHHRDQAMPHHGHLAHLPGELHTLIVSNLANRERKSLRLTCSRLRDRTPLHITRAFLSANERNLEVFRAIADHNTYRTRVTDIIWDDALLPARVDGGREDEDEDDTFIQLHGLTDPEASPVWFVRKCEENLQALEGRRNDDLVLPQYRDRHKQAETQLPLPVSYAYYQGLVMQQESILETQADVDALAYGLARFPALRRISITPATHGLLYEPLYETPMIRAFPYGFNYPIPRGWPTRFGMGSMPVEPPLWNSEAQKAPWRGVSVVLRALAEQKNHISELGLDVHGLATGLNCRLFDNPTCEEYQNLAAVLRRPGFHRIDLALLVAREQWEHRPPFRSGHLRRLLGGAGALEHLRLSTDLAPNQEYGSWHFDDLDQENELRLHDLCPVDKLLKLRHFGLAGFWVRQSDLIALLAAMPPSLRSVDLSNLRFFGDGNYRSLLNDMREQLHWRELSAGKRPRVTIAVGNDSGLYTVVDRVVCVEDEVGRFLYSDGLNPFGCEPDQSPNHIQWGFGVERDEFDPDFERPWVEEGWH